MLPSRSFIVSSFTFMFMVHFESIFVMRVRSVSRFIFFAWSSFSSTVCGGD